MSGHKESQILGSGTGGKTLEASKDKRGAWEREGRWGAVEVTVATAWVLSWGHTLNCFGDLNDVSFPPSLPPSFLSFLKLSLCPMWGLSLRP